MASRATAEAYLGQVIQPTLKWLAEANPKLSARRVVAMQSRAAQQLLLGTALAESRMLYVLQHKGGPARSLLQIEPGTFDDIWRRYGGFYRLVELVPQIYDLDLMAAVTWHPPLAVAVARLKYWGDRAPLPAPGDLRGQARYWKRVYNTRLGKGTVQGFVAKAGPTLKGIWPKDYPPSP